MHHSVKLSSITHCFSVSFYRFDTPQNLRHKRSLSTAWNRDTWQKLNLTNIAVKLFKIWWITDTRQSDIRQKTVHLCHACFHHSDANVDSSSCSYVRRDEIAVRWDGITSQHSWNSRMIKRIDWYIYETTTHPLQNYIAVSGRMWERGWWHNTTHCAGQWERQRRQRQVDLTGSTINKKWQSTVNDTVMTRRVHVGLLQWDEPG